MWSRIVAFFMSIIAFFAQLFGISLPTQTYSEFLDVSYGESANQVVDICLPKDSGTELGLIVFIHGGSWMAGDEDAYLGTIRNVAKDYKLAAASINYRFLSANGNIHGADILADVISAMECINKTVNENGYTIKAAAVGGDSAGGHLSLMYAYRYADIAPFKMAFVFSNAGPADLSDANFYKGSSELNSATAYALIGEMIDMDISAQNFNDAAVQAAVREYSPVSYVKSNSLPTLMAHGEKDLIVPYSNALTLEKALEEAGVEHYLYTYPNSGHNLADDPAVSSLYYAKLIELAEAYLK